MVQFKLAFGEGALDEAAFAIAKLSTDIISPEEEGSVVECGHAVSLTASDRCDMQWLLSFIKTIVELTQVFDKGPIVQVRGPVDAKLALEVIAACVDQLMGAFSLRSAELADNN